MSKILVLCEYANSKIKNSSLELLTAAKNSGGELGALMLGSEANSSKSEAAHYGAKSLYLCSSDKLNDYNSEVFSAVVIDAIEKSGADVILASSSVMSRDLFPTIAAKINAAIANDCTELNLQGEVSARKPLYAGKCTAKVEFSSDSKKIILMRPNQLNVEDPDTSAIAEEINLNAPELDLKTILKEIVKGTSEKLDLTEANIIVSGGRGLKDAESFKILEPLADVLGASIGASRAIVDAGWVPHNLQVGQTGKTVGPTLYIACGISGAIQHLAGMSDSKVIVAINTDADAPIFKKATYGIVGDVFDVVPKLTEEFKALLN